MYLPFAFRNGSYPIDKTEFILGFIKSNPDDTALRKTTFQHLFGKGIFNILLQRPFQRTCTIFLVDGLLRRPNIV